MRWGSFALVLAATYLLQVAVLFVLGWSWLDPFLILALVCALMAPTHEARLAGWITGLVQDLGSIDPLGLHAFTLGLAVWIVTKLREELNVHVIWPRLLVLLFGSFPALLVYWLHRAFWSGGGETSWWSMISQSFTTAAGASVIVLLITIAPWFARRGRRMRPTRRA